MRRERERELQKERLPQFEALRIRLLLRLMRDPCISACAEALSLDRETVRLWRDRYLEGGRAALKTLPRGGGPTRIDPVSRCVTQLALRRPG